MSKIIIMIWVFVLGSIGYNTLPEIMQFVTLPFKIPITFDWIGAILGGVIGYLAGLFTHKPIERSLNKVTHIFSKLQLSYLLFGSIGLVFGLIISWLISFSLQSFNIPIISNYLPFVIAALLGYLGFYVGSSRHRELTAVFRSQQEHTNIVDKEVAEGFYKYKILDTSTIIDGRILDVVRTGFMEGTLVVSKHVLRELQHIADSADSLKRTRGRRGLDILNELQSDEAIQVEMNDQDLHETEEVDLKLLHLAKELHGVVITNDFNLNKVAQFQNVKVLNVNELASVMQPAVIPGEQMKVNIVKKGTEHDQGVAYLDDGTMVVVEGGQRHIGSSQHVVVTSSLQTNSGRMIFAKLVTNQKSLDHKGYHD